MTWFNLVFPKKHVSQKPHGQCLSSNRELYQCYIKQLFLYVNAWQEGSCARTWAGGKRLLGFNRYLCHQFRHACVCVCACMCMCVFLCVLGMVASYWLFLNNYQSFNFKQLSITNVNDRILRRLLTLRFPPQITDIL